MDYRTVEAAKESGKEAGKWGPTERHAMNSLAGKAMTMDAQLDMMHHLISNPEVPEGQLAPAIQSLRSGLQSLGFPVNEKMQGATDFLGSLSTNFALHQRTAGGENLLPGAMSEWEDKLLLRMSPGLSNSKEGSLALISFMKEVNRSNRRLADEANKMADMSPGKILPPEWETRKMQVMRIEMNRIKFAAKDLAKRFELPPSVVGE